MKMKNIVSHLILLVLAAGLVSGCSLLGQSKDTPVAEKPEPKIWKTDDLKPDHLALAKKLVRDGFFDVALVQLEQAAKEDLPPSDRVRVYDLAGVCARETGDFKGASTWFAKALALDCRDASVHNNLGILHAMAGDGDNAVKSLEQASALDPGRADFFNNLGWACMEQKAFPRAESAFRKSLALDPDDPRVINNLALCLGLQGKETQAHDLLLRHQPPEQARHNLEVIRAMKGDPTSMGNSGQAFEIQSRNNREKNGEDIGLSGDTAHSIYSDKYLPSMKKD